VKLSGGQLSFLETNHTAAMITLRRDGSAHAVRCGVALVDGKVWSSGIPERVRTRHVRRDPRGSYFVFGQGPLCLTTEGRFRILDGPDAIEQNVRLFQMMQAGRTAPGTLMWRGKRLDIAGSRGAMRDERRLIFELDPERIYGLDPAP
jgi:hypothetical protein